MTANPENSNVMKNLQPEFAPPSFSSSALYQEMGLKVGQEASFAVQLNGARGLIDAKIHTPSGAVEECYVTELDSGKTHYCVFHNGTLEPEGLMMFSVQTGTILIHKLRVSADQHAIRFIPRENGVHSIDVRFNGSHIPGSPFKIRVGEPGQAGDPGLVAAFGPGLAEGTTGTH